MTPTFDPRAFKARRDAAERDFVMSMRAKQPVPHEPIRVAEYTLIVSLAAAALIAGWLVG